MADERMPIVGEVVTFGYCDPKDRSPGKTITPMDATIARVASASVVDLALLLDGAPVMKYMVLREGGAPHIDDDPGIDDLLRYGRRWKFKE